MSVKVKSLRRIEKSVLHYHQLERGAKSPLRRQVYRVRRWVAMLHFEVVKNDVTIRAESLSYYTLFSFMPLIAGVFLILSFFSQWGPIQKEFESLLARVLDAIPPEQKKTLMAFILQFKDQYLENLNHRSGAIGVFALVTLIWVGARVFFNIESLMNGIWAVKEDRAWSDRLKNFFFCMVLLPFFYAATISIPRILEHFTAHRVSLILDQGLFVLIVFFSFSFILKFFPNTKVSWKSAGMGALASTLGFGAANYILRFYFKMGTQTAYGKAAVLPLFAFFIYVSWLIFILSVEVSLLVEQGRRMLRRQHPETTLYQALILEKIIHRFTEQFESGRNPLTVSELTQEFNLHESIAENLIEYLLRRGLLLEVSRKISRDESGYALAHRINDDDLLSLIKDYLNLTRLSQDFDVFDLISRLKRV